jgi:hypothetical protein
MGGWGGMFEDDSADSCAGKFLLMSMGGQVEGIACADLGAMTNDVSGLTFVVATIVS